MGGGGFPQGAGLAGWAVRGGGPIINARPGRREADHQRKAWEAGRSSTEGLEGGGPIISPRPGRRVDDHQRKALEAGGRSSTHGHGTGDEIRRDGAGQG